MPVAQVWPPLLPHLSIGPVGIDALIPEVSEVWTAKAGEAALEVIDAGTDDSMDPVAATTAEGLSVSNVSGK